MHQVKAMENVKRQILLSILPQNIFLTTSANCIFAIQAKNKEIILSLLLVSDSSINVEPNFHRIGLLAFSVP